MSERVVKYIACYVTKRGNRKAHPYVLLLIGYVEKDGKRIRKQTSLGTYRTKREADEERIKQMNSLKTAAFVAPSRMSTAEYLECWLRDYVNGGKYKLRTKEAYELVVKMHLIPALGRIPIQELSAKDIEVYYSKCRNSKAPLSETTLQQHHAILHKALEVAASSMKLISVNPVGLVDGKPRRRKGAKLLRTWSREERNRLLVAAESMGERQAAFYHMAFETGMRKGELCGLRWEDVITELGQGEVFVRSQLIKPGPDWKLDTPKNGRERSIAISDVLVRKLMIWRKAQSILKETCKDYGDTKLVFTSKMGRPLLINNIGQREFKKLIETAGVKKLRFHDIRHTNASLLLAEGAEMKVVSERLGHSSVSITMDIYCHTSAAAHREVARSYEADSLIVKKSVDPVNVSIYNREDTEREGEFKH